MVRRAGLDECGKSRPPPGSDPRPPGPWRVVIRTTLPRPVPVFMAQVNGLFLSRYRAGDKIKKNEMGWACGAYG